MKTPTSPQEWIPELDTTLQGRLLDIWKGRSGLPPAEEEAHRDILRKKAGKVVKKAKCKFLGDDTGKRIKCTPCGDEANNPRLKIFLCSSSDTRGECTLEFADESVDSCSNCKFHKLPDADYPSLANLEESSALAEKLRIGFPDVSSTPESVIRGAHIILLKEAVENPPSVNKGEGRGIVMGVGGTLYFSCAWVAISVLREMGCKLPVEWWHLGPAEIDPQMASLAKEHLGVECVDALQVASKLPLNDKPRILNGWELKPFSIAHSGFQEVMYLDADNIVASDPTPLFDNAEYQHHGAAFWPDLPPYDRKEWVPDTAWYNCGLEPRQEIDFESGQLIVNKGKCAREIGVTVHINGQSDWYYKFVYGDKTTFHLGWRACGTDYAMPKTGAGWIWPAILQYDFNGNLQFNHVCQGKQQLADGKPLAIHRKKEAIAAAVLLKRFWSGKIWGIEDQTSEENLLINQIQGKWKYTRKSINGSPQRLLALSSTGKIEDGYAGCEQAWAIRIIKGTPTLVITGEAHKGTKVGMMFLTESEDGIWRGNWQAHERGAVEMERVK